VGRNTLEKNHPRVIISLYIMNNSNEVLQNSFLSSKYFNPDYLFSQGSDALVYIFHHIFGSNTLTIIHNILSLFAIFFLSIIAYTAVRMLEIRKREHEHLHHEIEEYAHHQHEKEKVKWSNEAISQNQDWINVLLHIREHNESEWKQAVLEADVMLEKLMDQLGFFGQDLGERLRNADKQKFRNLAIAWEVHTIRNRIAHEGSAFTLSHHEANRVIALYEQIFREFGFI
jgi:hypothetical protein